MVAWLASAFTVVYLEACMRAYIDGAVDPTFLSSGTEDYFNSAMYFDGGVFREENSGLTFKNDTSHAMSAYRVHERDPIVFSSGIRLVWRNSEDPLECPFTWPWPPTGRAASEHLQRAAEARKQRAPSASESQLVPVDVEFLVWTYEWDTLWHNSSKQ